MSGQLHDPSSVLSLNSPRIQLARRLDGLHSFPPPSPLRHKNNFSLCRKCTVSFTDIRYLYREHSLTSSVWAGWRLSGNEVEYSRVGSLERRHHPGGLFLVAFRLKNCEVLNCKFPTLTHQRVALCITWLTLRRLMSYIYIYIYIYIYMTLVA